jgi:hypothetical protein
MKSKVLIFIACLIASAALAQTPKTQDTNPPAKHGYSKEKSAVILDAQVKAFLDGALRAYHEPGLFTHRQKLMRVLGVIGARRVWEEDERIPSHARRGYRDFFHAKGLFARPGWTGQYWFDLRPWRSPDRDYTWGAEVFAQIDHKLECLNLNVVKAYLALTFVDFPRRSYESFYASDAHAISRTLPALELKIEEDCVVEIWLGQNFSLREVSDENVYR